MRYALIKNNICINIAVFDEDAPMESYREIFRHDGICDDIVLIPEGFEIGDTYQNGEWSKQIPTPPEEPDIEPDNTPTTEERISALEMAMSFMLGM